MIDFFCFCNMIFVPSFFAQLILVKVCFTYFLVFAHLVFVKVCLIYSSGFCSVGICKSVCIPAFGSLCSIAASILCFFSPLLINLSQKCSLCPFGRLLSRREVACSYVNLISCDFLHYGKDRWNEIHMKISKLFFLMHNCCPSIFGRGADL